MQLLQWKECSVFTELTAYAKIKAFSLHAHTHTHTHNTETLKKKEDPSQVKIE